jgi:hypothetical protein
MALKEFLDKVIIQNGGGTYEMLDDGQIKSVMPVGKDGSGKMVFDVRVVNPKSALFPLALDWRENLISPADLSLLKGAEGLVDAKGVEFDPEIHIINNDGSPKLAMGKYFCKKKEADVASA